LPAPPRRLTQGILNTADVICRGSLDRPPRTITREFAAWFFDALMTRDPERIAPYLAEDVDWLIVDTLGAAEQVLGRALLPAAEAPALAG
jgi:hypothetical protein